MSKSNSILRRTAIQTAAAAGFVAASAASKSNAAEKPHDTIIGRTRSGESSFKDAARADHAINMRPFGGALSSTQPPELAASKVGAPRTPWQYDVLIIGSGYGASIYAARLGQKSLPTTRIAMLERGSEWSPGNYPDRIRDVARQARMNTLGLNRRSIANPIGLYNLLQTDELMIISSSGLGGCSLVNANVALRPDREVFEQPQWPTALSNRDFLEAYYELTAWEQAIQVDPYDWTPKMRAQRLAAEHLSDIGCHYEAAAIAITRNSANPQLPVLNRQGMLQRNCIDCGDCMTGCNVGAKNTLMMNYLPIAARHGVQMFTHCEVRQVHRQHDHYVIEYLHHCQAVTGEVNTTRRFVSARCVVLGAGSVGSSEILLRSRESNLQISAATGCNWTSNGDALGFVDNSKLCTQIAGTSAYPADRRSGPTIQTNLTYPNRSRLVDRVLIQEGAATRTYTNILGGLFLDMKLESTMVLLGMGHDGQQGRVVLHEDGNANVTWPGLLESSYRQKIREELALVASAHGGKYRHLHPPHDRMITVHPLGGCGMSDDPRLGVTDHRGRVFDLRCGGDVNSGGQSGIHNGLYVSDGSLFPTAIAVNPYFTISAVAERNSQLMLREPQYADLFVQS